MTLTFRRMIILAAALVFAVMITGCTESAIPEATGKSNIRGVNAIVTAPSVSFAIEERQLDSLDYKGATPFNTFDDLSYNFNFDIQLPEQFELVRVATQFVDVLADHEYTVVLTGTIANPQTLFWEDPIREWAESDTVFEVFFAHLAPSLGSVDVYFAPTGTTPVLGQAVATLSNGERPTQIDLEQGSYEIIVTPPDDPATIIYQSVPLNTTAQTRLNVAIFDPDPTTPGNLGVNFIDASGSTALPDVNFPPQMRALHAAFGTENVDGYLESDFANLIYNDIAFQELSPYADLSSSVTLLTLTPVGNSGATIHEDSVTSGRLDRRTVVLAGKPGDLQFIQTVDNARPLETSPVIRIVNTAFNVDAIDIYSLEPGTPIDDAVPIVRGIPSGTDTQFFDRVAGSLEFTATLLDEKTPISTPLVLDLANGDVVSLAVFDTVDPQAVELLVYDTLTLP